MTIRRVALRRAGMLLLLAACAQMDPPPGGPEDRMPPYVVAQRPDSLAVVPNWRQPVHIEFSERISEQQVEESVMVSPRTSPVLVDRGSRSIRVSLRRGWEPGQIYQVTIRPVVQDLFNNRLAEAVEVIFSTGPAIPDTRMTGMVLDRITGEPVVDARVEAIRQPDSLVYAVPSDSTGAFVFAHVPEGEYQVRAFPDANRNREMDPFEQRDSLLATITTADTAAAVELSLVLPDSTPPVIASANAGAGGRIDVRFDDHLDPAQTLEPAAVTITGPDGVAVGIVRVTIGEPPEEEAVDSTAVVAAPDTTGPAAAPDTALAGVPGVPAAAAQDTVPAAERRLPSQLVVVQLAEGVELTPEAEYTVAVVGVRNVVGLTGASEETFTAPEPPEPPPQAPADTVPQDEPPPGR